MADLHSLRYSLFLSIGSLLAFGIALIWIFFIRRDPLWIIWGLLLSDVILIFPLLIASSLLKGTRDIWGKEREEKVFRFLKRYAVYGFPLIGWFLGIFLLNLSDRYFIQAYQGSAQVGIYSSNYNLVLGIFNLIAAPIISAAHPIIMKTASSDNVDKGQLPDIIKSFSRYYLFVSIPIFIFMSILAKNIVTVFLGVEYREGYVIIPIILFGYFAWNFAMYGHKGLELEEKTKIMLFFVFICALCNVALNFLFVPLFGYVGAAVTSLIGLTLYPVLVYFGSRKTMPWRVPWAYIAKALAASSVMAGILLVFDRFLRPDSTLITLIIEGTLAAIIYLAGMAILGEVKVGRLAELRYLAARRSN
jgi:O-antigen/teichoic acid export membrane protein